MRLSVLMRVPLADVLGWPDAHVRLQLAFLAKEPSIEQRLELGIAQLSALVFNRSRGDGEEGKDIADYLLCDDPWHVKPPKLSAYELRMLSRPRPVIIP